jgi:hypothetical protein
MAADESVDAGGSATGNQRPKEELAAPAGQEADVQSDPARDATEGGDWTDEGGATPEGAATNTDTEHHPVPED